MPLRPVFLVHGVGTQEKGEHLSSVVEPWVQFLRKHLGPDQVKVEANLRPGVGPAHAALQFEGETWDIWEVHWAKSFHSLKSFQVLVWGFQILKDHTLSIFMGLFPRWRKDPYPDSSNPVYERRPRPRTAKVYDRLVGTLALVLFIAVYPLTLFAASVFFLLSQLPLGLLSTKLKELTIKLTEMLVEGPGDMAAILLTETQFASIRGQLKELMQQKVVGTTPDKGPERVTVIAHSAGATIAYAVLKDASLWAEWTKAHAVPESISFLTFGSSLNMAWRADSKHPIWSRSLDGRVRWVDFWARYDPVPHGPAIPEMKEEVRGNLGGVFENVRVVNNDSPLSDHSAYWGNHPEVVSRVLYEVANVPREPGPLWDVICHALDDIPRHRNWIGKVALVRALGPLLLLGLVVLLELFTTIAPGSSLGRPIVDLILPDWGWLLDLQRNRFLHWLVGTGGIGIILYSLWQMARLWIIDPTLSKKYRPSAEMVREGGVEPPRGPTGP